MANVVVNGVTVSYGPVRATNPFGGFDMRGDTSARKFLQVHFTYDELPTGGEGTRNLVAGPIPFGAVIIDAYWRTVVPFAGAGLNFDVGLEAVNGTGVRVRDGTGGTAVTNKDELWDALALANINSVREVNVASMHDGTNSGILCARQVDKAVAAGTYHLDQDGYLVVTAAAGTPTAGEAIIVVEYYRPTTIT